MTGTRTGAQGTAQEPTALKRALTTPLLYFFILGDVLGAGVYVLVGQVAADAGERCGSPSSSPCCWRC